MEKFSSPHYLESHADPGQYHAKPGVAYANQCGRCKLRNHCFGRQLSDLLPHPFEQHMQIRQIPRGGQAYRSGADFHAIYFIREGAFKNQVRNAKWDEFIVGFALRGDVLGLDGCAEGYYLSHPVALQDSEICEFPYQDLQTLSLDHPPLRNLLQLLMGRALARAQQERVLIGRLSAEERLRSFLQDIAHRLTAPGASADRFELPMTREDIAEYLGLQMETVSRAFHKLQAGGFLHVHRRHIELARKALS